MERSKIRLCSDTGRSDCGGARLRSATLRHSNTPHPRLGLGAHIQFVTNGILILMMAVLLLKLQHHVGPKSIGVMSTAAWLIWPMALSEAANGWWGTTQMLPIAAGQAGATGGAVWQEVVVKVTHVAAGLALVVAWGLLVAAFLKKPAAADTLNG